MSANKTFLGRRMMDFTSSPAFQQYSRVTLWVDDNNCYTAGDDSGRTLEADCPWATQEICDDVLARINGYQYVPYTATDAMLDPSAEIGDGVTANGRYSVLASIEPTFDSMFTATVEAPADEELDHEFPYKSSATRAFDRNLAQTRAAITVKADEIMAKVEDELNGLSSSIDIKLDSITSTVQGLDGKISTLEQTDSEIRAEITDAVNELSSSIDIKLDGITLETIGADGKVSSVKLFDTGKIDLTGYATFTGLSGGTTTIDGGCIKTGMIDAERINLTGAITFGDLDADLKQAIEDAGSVDLPSYIKSTYIDSTEIKSPTITGNNIAVYNTFQTIGYDGVNQVATGYMGATLGQDAYGNDTLGVALSNAWSSGNPGSKYVIVTNRGARMQGGSNSVVVTASGAELSYDSGSYKIRVDSNGCRWYDGSWHDIGSGGSAETVTVVPVWG